MNRNADRGLSSECTKSQVKGEQSESETVVVVVVAVVVQVKLDVS